MNWSKSPLLFKHLSQAQQSRQASSKLARRLPTACLSAVMATAMGVSAWAPRAIARPKPPANGSYVAARGGASRGCGGQQSILGLVPTEEIENNAPALSNSTLKLSSKIKTTGSYTSEARPSFWFHVPFEAGDSVALEFILQNSEDEDVYRTAIASPEQAGLIEVTLPDSVAELAMEQRYNWFLKATFDCPESGSSESPVQESKGWVTRYEPEPSLKAQLESASPQQQVQLYQNAGYWFDALSGIANLRMAEPGSAALREDWDTLLGLYKISEDAAQAEFVDCCQAVAAQVSTEFAQ